MTDDSLFERLARSDDRMLDAVFRASPPPPFDTLVGFQWRGWNADPRLRYLRLRKFIKAFFRGTNGDEGCNVRVRQNGLTDPWRPLLRAGRIQPFAYYLVRQQDARTRLLPNPRALLIDYGATPRNPWWHLERGIRDYLVQPSAENPDVMLGRAWVGVGRARVGSSFFVIERFAPFDVEPDGGQWLSRRGRVLPPSS